MNNQLTSINFGLTIFLLIIALWYWLKFRKLDTIRKHFYSDGLERNLETVLSTHDSTLRQITADIATLNKQTESIRLRNEINYQKMGLVKYSQYGEAGNLSFSLTILNEHNDGYVISSLHGREGCRVYAKAIIAAKSKAKLTEEEQQALTQAIS